MIVLAYRELIIAGLRTTKSAVHAADGRLERVDPRSHDAIASCAWPWCPTATRRSFVAELWNRKLHSSSCVFHSLDWRYALRAFASYETPAGEFRNAGGLRV